MQATSEAATTQDVFILDVQVIAERPANGAGARCSTNDGCASTCASSCASRG